MKKFRVVFLNCRCTWVFEFNFYFYLRTSRINWDIMLFFVHGLIHTFDKRSRVKTLRVFISSENGVFKQIYLKKYSLTNLILLPKKTSLVSRI